MARTARKKTIPNIIKFLETVGTDRLEDMMDNGFSCRECPAHDWCVANNRISLNCGDTFRNWCLEEVVDE